MKRLIYIGCVLFLLQSCMKDQHYSSDFGDSSLLPSREDYLNKDYGTQELAQEIYEAYSGFENDSCDIGLVIYDNETRTKPIITFTESKWTIQLNPLTNGMLEIGFLDLKTEMMPLMMNAKINVLLKLDSSQDTIWLSGMDGRVRTIATPDQPIGTPLPESDDAELTGYYVRSNKNLSILFDLMLPIAVKANIHGSK